MADTDERIKKLEQMLIQKTDSISVAKGMSGRTGFEIKIYTENLKDDKQRDEAIDKLAAIHEKLKRVFPDDPIKR